MHFIYLVLGYDHIYHKHQYHYYSIYILYLHFFYISYFSKGIGSSWIGLDDKQEEGTYVWQDSTVLQPSEEGWNSGNV
jgi:hypothetical protein